MEVRTFNEAVLNGPMPRLRGSTQRLCLLPLHATGPSAGCLHQGSLAVGPGAPPRTASARGQVLLYLVTSKLEVQKQQVIGWSDPLGAVTISARFWS